MPFSEIQSRIRNLTKAHIAFAFFILLFVVGVFMIIWKINQEFLIPVPAHGGSFDEGIIGSPRFINPVLAFSDADQDMTALVYSGLMKTTKEGSLELDLASNYTVSDDGLVYTFTLRDDIYFHDGEPVSVEDVFFTISKVQDDLVRSTQQSSWDGVAVRVIDNNSIEFTLPRAFGPFLENTTIGILPAHIWKNIPADQFSYSLYNIEPVGSGPYYVRSIERNASGIPTEYKLRSFNKYALGRPFIKDIRIHLFENETELLDAYKRGTVDSLYEISNRTIDQELRKGSNVVSTSLPQSYGVFFNTDVAPVFLTREIRQALSAAIDRERIVSEVFGGYATAIANPIPPALFEAEEMTGKNIERANALMQEAGWKKNQETGLWQIAETPLAFTIRTSDTPELIRAAEILDEEWSGFGANVEIEILSVSDLNQSAIRAREYEALLFGTSVGRQGDLYSFWHSSGRNDPGLNIALYTNIDVDAIVEDLRQAISPEEREELYSRFYETITTETPAAFLFSPDFTYITSDNIQNNTLGILNNQSERFADVHEWYIETDKVWNIFNNENSNS